MVQTVLTSGFWLFTENSLSRLKGQVIIQSPNLFRGMYVKCFRGLQDTKVKWQFNNGVWKMWWWSSAELTRQALPIHGIYRRRQKIPGYWNNGKICQVLKSTISISSLTHPTTIAGNGFFRRRIDGRIRKPVRKAAITSMNPLFTPMS